MHLVAALNPGFFVAELLVALAFLAVGVAVLVGGTVRTITPRSLRGDSALVEAERDMAADMGITFRTWGIARGGVLAFAMLVTTATGLPLLMAAGFIGAVFGFRWMLAGRAAKSRVARERAFFEWLRDLRERMVAGNQSLDIALGDLGQSPSKEMAYMLAPLKGAGSMVDRLKAVGQRSRSPIIEGAMGTLIFSRSRSAQTLINAIDEIIVPVGMSQVSISEESIVTLAQQRAVSYAMMVLLTVMLGAVLHTDSFATFYHSVPGQVTLFAVLCMFVFLIWLVGKLVKTPKWTRWDLDELAELEVRLGGGAGGVGA